MLRFRVGTGAGPVDIHATHLEHSDQEKQATQVAEITSAIPRRAVSEGGVPGKETGFLSAFHLKMRHFTVQNASVYQDRLGTHIEKNSQKETGFLQRSGRWCSEI